MCNKGSCGSRRDIDDLGLASHFISEVTAEVLQRVEVDPSAKDPGEFVLMSKEGIPGHVARLVFD